MCLFLEERRSIAGRLEPGATRGVGGRETGGWGRAR